MVNKLVQIPVTEVIATIKQRIIKFQSENPLEVSRISEDIGFDVREDLSFNRNVFRIVFNYISCKPKVLITIKLIDAQPDIRFSFLCDSVVFSGGFWYDIVDQKLVIPMIKCYGKFEMMESNSIKTLMELIRLSYDEDFQLIFNKVLGFEFSLDRSKIWFHI